MGYKTSGYVQLRRGLYEHVRKGLISFSAASLYAAMIVDADTDNGICYGSAGLFSAVYGIPSRSVRKSLEELESNGYIKRLKVQGKHGAYPILINKFECSSGAMKGYRLDALKSTSCDNLEFFVCHDDAAEMSMTMPEDRERKKEKEKEQKLSAKVKPSPDPRAKDFRQDFEKAFQFSNGVPAPWDAKEATNLKRWLAKNPTITRDQWRTILRNRKASPINQKSELSRWISNALAWLDGPADEWGKPTNGGNFSGKRNQETKSDRSIANLRELLGRADPDFGSVGADGSPAGHGGREGLFAFDDGRTVEGEFSPSGPASAGEDQPD